MFAGIVESTGVVVAKCLRDGVARLDVDLGALADGVAPGASIAVAGVCLTVSELRGNVAGFDVVPETLMRTTLGARRAGDAVNLERSLRAGQPIDGHVVQGHVDATARVRSNGADAIGDWRLRIARPVSIAPYLVAKGSIAVDGVSLTIAETDADSFTVALIPTTLARTTLGALRADDPVNLESDIIARLVIARVDALLGADAGGGGPHASLDHLRAAGILR